MSHNEEPLPFHDIEQIDDWIEQTLRARLPQPENQRDRSDPQLIQELRDYYVEEARTVNDRLERVWQRFEQRAEIQPRERRPVVASAAEPHVPRERLYPMEQLSSLAHAFRRWPARLSALVAAVLLVALVGGLIGGLVLVHHPGNGTGHPVTAPRTATPNIQPSPTPIGQANLLFSDLRMTSATTGWTWATPPNTTWGDMAAYKVLRTTDGGRHWKDVTPPFTTAQPQVSGLPFHPYSGGSLPVLQLFLNDSTAWMLDLPNKLYVTTDSGRSWQVITTPAEVAQYTFINPDDGWMIGTDGDVYRTLDGGKDWTKLQSMSQVQVPPGILPYSNTLTGIVFLNANDGWLTGLTNQTDAAWFYVTHDGGKTWQQQALPLPAGTIDPPILLSPPTFVSNQDGYVWANLNIRPLRQNLAGVPQSGGGGLELYTTNDGGATWQDRSLLPGGVGALSFSDGSHGWVSAEGSNTPALWGTSDGAQHWSQIDTSQNLVSVGQLDFVSETTGWAICYVDNVQSQVLLKTVDGGHTWSQINYSILS